MEGGRGEAQIVKSVLAGADHVAVSPGRVERSRLARVMAWCAVVSLVAGALVLTAGCGSQDAPAPFATPRTDAEPGSPPGELPAASESAPPASSVAEPPPAVEPPPAAESPVVAEPPPPVPSEPEPAPQPEPAPPLPQPTPGAKLIRTGTLPPDTYTTTAFKERFELDLPSGWAGVMPEQEDVVLIARDGSLAESIAFIYPGSVTGVIDPAVRASDVDVLQPTDVAPAPVDWIDWLTGHARLGTGTPVELEVGGLPALGVDVDVVDGYESDGCPGQCVFTFFDSRGAIYANSTLFRERNIAVEVDEAEVVIQISAPSDRFDAFVREAETVLRTVRFVETRPPLTGEGTSPAPAAPAPSESVPAPPEPAPGVPAPPPPAESEPTETDGLPPFTVPEPDESPLEA